MIDVLLLGSSGLLGAPLARALADAGLAVATPARARADLAAPAALAEEVERLKPRVVINAAAYTDVDGAERDRDAALAVNARGAGHLAGAAAAVGALLVHVSTDFVFDGEARRPYREEAPIGPLGWYAITKAMGEANVRANTPNHLIIRVAWLHGIDRTCFVTKIAERLFEGRPVAALTRRFASPTSAEHLAAALSALAWREVDGEQLPRGTYHLAGEGAATPFDMALAVADACGAPRQLVHGLDVPSWSEASPRPLYAVLDTARARRELGLALPPWREGVRATVAALREFRAMEAMRGAA